MRRSVRLSSALLVAAGVLLLAPAVTRAESIDLSHATVVVRAAELGGALPAAEKMASVILREEIAKRAGTNWTVTDKWPEQATAIIALSTVATPPAWKDQVP